jgi:protein TonB
MFEDSTFESAGRIRTRSRRWMIAAFTFNASILLALVLIPLVCPEALPRLGISILMEVPPPPARQEPPKTLPAHTTATHREYTGPLIAPSVIPDHTFVPSEPEAPIDVTVLGPPGGLPGGTGPLIPGQSAPRIVHPDVPTKLRVSSLAEAVLIIQKTRPVYPPIALAAGVEGTVMLAATISKTGTIENLHVTSGPPLLQQAALDAVKTWRYRPYLLNGQPVDVETTVSVVFTLGR